MLIPSLLGRLPRRLPHGVLTATGEPVPANRKIPKTAAPHVPPDTNAAIVHWAHWGLLNLRGKLLYSENANRSQLFHCKPGVVPAGTHADCSQFYSTCAHWAGIKAVNDRDWTGTLVLKGKESKTCFPGAAVIFGAGAGVHVGVAAEKEGADWWVIAFGHAGAPDRVLLSALKAYFAKEGHPGVRFFGF